MPVKSFVASSRGSMSVHFLAIFTIVVSLACAALLTTFVSTRTVNYVTMYNTLFFGAIALTLGIVGFERLKIFPGIISGSYIFMFLSTSFSAVATLLLLLRIEYSAVQLLSTYAISIALYAYFHQKIVIPHRMRVGVVPSQATNNLPSLPNVDWIVLDLHKIANIAISEVVDLVVTDLNADHSDAWDEHITKIVMSGTPVYHYKQILEQTMGRVEIKHLSENNLGSLSPNNFYLKSKSIFDIALAALILILTAPLILMIAAIVRLESPGPAFFRQRRMGYRMRPFTLYKIRTMRVSQQQWECSSKDEREAAMTKVGDPRITRLGHFLRLTRLDELPQLINIVKGEMSLIGPRPEAIALSAWYEREIPFYHYRHIIKPGVTGWAQVNQGHVVDIDDTIEKLHLDFYYVKNFSFWLDLLILLKTIKTMVTGFGAR
jgi:exopolysaccharide biosynthesis polyprenyl glycosylphosphotransferase